MRWREQKRAAILEVLAQGAHMSRSRIGSLDIATQASQIPSAAFILACVDAIIDSDKIRIDDVESFSVGCDLFAEAALVDLVSASDVSSATAPVDVPAMASKPISVDDWSFVIPKVLDFHFNGHAPNAFAFREQRPERTLLRPRSLAKREHIRERRPREQSPTIEPEAATLEDRLRWILMPPIHELLSDPQLTLPAAPYPYQQFGITWLYGHKHALLGDEMGLGKTMQAIIAARLLWRAHEIERILIICPKPLITTWLDEIEKWWPAARMNTRRVEGDKRFFLKLGTESHAIKVINYEALATTVDWIKSERFFHDLIIIDEAQRIKNPASKTAQAVKSLKSDRRWALTGTPLENTVGDLVSIFDFVKPGLLRGDEVEYVRNAIKPFFLRRRTEDVALDLPDKDDQDVSIELTDEQRDVYVRAERDGVIELNEKGDTITVQHVFALIQKLIQCCNFEPRSGKSGKLDRLLEELEEIAANQRKALVFSQYVQRPFGLQKLSEYLRNYSVVEMHGQVSEAQREINRLSFDRDPRVNVMLLQYRAGGVGLNLQAANYVFLFDRWWNPAVEDQAVKRAHRIGQGQKVFVRRFYCRDTIEERILQKLGEKRRLFDHVIDDQRPSASAMGLSEEEVFSLFKDLRVRPKRSSGNRTGPRIILDNLDAVQFEELVAKLYEDQGFVTELTPQTRDGGIDVIAEKRSESATDRVVIQCKHQRHKVGRPELQKLWGIVHDDPSITRADIVTSSDFTTDAASFALGKRLTLVNRSLLLKLLNQYGTARPE